MLFLDYYIIANGISGLITNQVKSLTKDIVKSICGFDFFYAITGLKYKLVWYK
jgi:hypothetical protein